MAFAFVLVVMTLLAASTAITAVTAQEEGTPPEVPYEAVHAVWAVAKATPIALVMAFATVLVGYLSKTSPEKFKLVNLIFTVLISLAIGTLTVYAGWTYVQIETWLANGFLTWYFWKLANILANAITKNGKFTPPASGPPTTT